ncbi:transcriptional regulator [Elizabethkingia meningoseptica]|uniref:DNA-binding response regulator n=1 Tax=Elizabethkingia meningoseptica TaxID=238 RepID=UPI00099901CF|nr:response regulator [Elizabethkingia meningoseptica]OPC33522.1 transcriptional regulator [Elizabethkingia meningoseptica]
MFKKILVAEDYESANISVEKALADLKIEESKSVYYCDDALQRVQIAIHEKQPFELLITDLSFEEDHREQNLKNGTELIEAVKKIQPDIKVIVFSIEKKPNIIDNLFSKYQINGYVSKAREDTKELKKAILAVYNNEKHISMNLKKSIKEKNSYEFTSYDITLVDLLCQGMRQQAISDHLKESGVRPSSLSSVEKRLNGLKESLNVNTTEQVVAIFKDMGLI